MEIQIRKLTPAFAAEARGADLSDGSETQYRAIREAWLASSGVLVVRDQHLTPGQHVAFGRMFGDVYTYESAAVARYVHPDHPEIYRVSNKVIEGKPQGRKGAGTYWHSDQSYEATPPSASILHAIEIPPVGGDTVFADLHRAYEALSAPMKAFLQPLKAFHSLAVAARTSYGKDLGNAANPATAPSAVQPLVRVHPETGRRSLFVNPGFTAAIEGLTAEESDAVLAMLFAHIAKPDFCYRHTWSPHDLVIWDNRTTNHYAVADYDGVGERLMNRVTVRGEAAVGV